MAVILVVDDEPQFRRVMRIALEARGYDVREAGSGPDALAMVEKDVPQLVLLDWQMPGPNGLEICRTLRDSLRIPVIVVTSKNRSGREQAIAAGANDYITKPFEFDYLMARVESVLSR